MTLFSPSGCVEKRGRCWHLHNWSGAEVFTSCGLFSISLIAETVSKTGSNGSWVFLVKNNNSIQLKADGKNNYVFNYIFKHI
jgi:hypothetical protein